ncbi:MAG: 16S rRNA (uracil(1498)-N(3))-methyltransferase [Acidobacteriota bacterium]|nr:16S rRNA (uracil(1498)-N(3))-methyltransferase [Acidobacteriota bacterium]MDH3530963.1 16S rRNA (uracil(1498)-N(3))-methyltransferase [Acidobacteriota bacterium]
MSERRFYVSPSEFAETIELGPEESRHIAKVLRLAVGKEICAFDGLGNERAYLIKELNRSSVLIEFIREVEPASPESPLRISLAVPLLKKSNTELILQKATELGVHRFTPLITSRTVVGGERWRTDRVFKIAGEAARQCGRATLPLIDAPLEFEEFLSRFEGPGLLFYEKHAKGLPKKLASESVTVVTGPEGGWETEEIDKASAAGFDLVHFGGRILKAETAAIVATAIVQNRFGDLN